MRRAAAEPRREPPSARAAQALSLLSLRPRRLARWQVVRGAARRSGAPNPPSSWRRAPELDHPTGHGYRPRPAGRTAGPREPVLVQARVSRRRASAHCAAPPAARQGIHGGVAQWLEQRLHKPRVGGSSPSTATPFFGARSHSTASRGGQRPAAGFAGATAGGQLRWPTALARIYAGRVRSDAAHGSAYASLPTSPWADGGTRSPSSSSLPRLRPRLVRSSRARRARARAVHAAPRHFDILLAPIESGPQKMRLSPASDRGSRRALRDLDSITAFPAAAAPPPHHADLRPQPQQRERARPRA